MREHFLSISLAAAVVFAPGCRNSPEESGSKNIPQSEAFDYCIRHPNPNLLARAGLLDVTNIIIPGDKDAISEVSLTRGNIMEVAESSSYKIVLIPSGYDDQIELGQRLSYIARIANRVFEGLGVSFSYLDLNLPIGIKREIRMRYSQALSPYLLSNESEAELAHQKIKEVYDADNILVVFREGLVAGSKAKFAIASGNSPYSGFVASHEAAHIFGLSDAYKRFYPNMLNGHTELFTSSGTLNEHTRRITEELEPEVVNTGNTCNGTVAYRFYGGRGNLMMGSYPDHILIAELDSGMRIFNPVQEAFIKRFVARSKG